MAIYRGDPNNLETLSQWLKKCEKLTKKRKENKEKLIEDLIEDMFHSGNEWENYIQDLCRESLRKRTQKELKEILYG